MNNLCGIGVSDATVGRLRLHLALLERWNASINLVARSTLAQAWERHILDSAQLLAVLPGVGGHWVDLGSGAGFPGLVVATILAETSPESRVTLIEADQRKATFLREVARETGVAVTVLARRIEAAAPQGADIVSARALAPLDRLLPLVSLHLGPGGTALLPKGAQADTELALATRAWSFSVERRPSQTATTAEILCLKGLHHV